MPLLGSLIKQGLKLGIRVSQSDYTPIQQQRRELRKLIRKAGETAFGMAYDFNGLLQSRNFVREFIKKVPVHNYNSIFQNWWHRCLEEEENVCWPGTVKYFALSSGTSEAASKHIPVTRDMVRAMRKASIRQILTLGKYDLPASFFEKGLLWLGGSTDLRKHGGYYEGDVSGISARRVPIWFQRYYKPGKKISRQKDWNIKLEEITEQAQNWDISIITGVPAWVQLLMEKVMERYKLNSIHEIWPNLLVFAHGGVAFEPYRKSFEKFFSKPVHFIEMYPASEGFIAFQSEPGARDMKLVLNNGIFFEFVPFDETNFNSDGELINNPTTLLINEVEEQKDYALLMSTCAGAWRYLIGDVIRFTSKEQTTIRISGRTKSFLSLVGEHLSVENMNHAVEFVAQTLNMEIPEYTVSGIPYDGFFAHYWIFGVHGNPDIRRIRELLDQKLSELNDDYLVERKAALKNVFVETVPVEKFYDFMKIKGRMGGQNKFPRVLKPEPFEDFKNFLRG